MGRGGLEWVFQLFRQLLPMAESFRRDGVLEDDINVDLPFPRDAADEAVAVAKAQVLRKFEELDLVAT